MKRKKHKKVIFLQDCGIYSNQVLVAVDCQKNDLIKWLKKEKGIKEEIGDALLGDDKVFEILKDSNAVTSHKDGRILLLLKDFADSWDFWECLIHELHHVVLFIAKGKKFEEEMEAQAYLQEYLFHSIRRKLMGIDKK